tara:strand:- start:159 stop:674 length:516 start_codon:yes stop_codon:yes gene_type:complete
MTTIVSPPFVVSEVLNASSVVQLLVEMFAQKRASDGCATPKMEMGIASAAGDFDCTVLVTSQSAVVERVASCKVSHAARKPMPERLPRTPDESIVIGTASTYLILLFALHEMEMISFPVTATPAATVRRTVGAALPVGSSEAITFSDKSTYELRRCVGAEVGAELNFSDVT